MAFFAIVLAAEHLLRLGGLDVRGQRVDGRCEVAGRPPRPAAPTRRARRGPSSRRVSWSRTSRSTSRRRRRCSTFWACCLVLPEVGRRGALVELLQLAAGWAASKIAPQIGGAGDEVVGAADQFVEQDGHRVRSPAPAAGGARQAAARRRPRVAARASTVRRRTTGQPDLQWSHKRSGLSGTSPSPDQHARSRTGRSASVTRPYGSTMPLMPVLAARTR